MTKLIGVYDTPHASKYLQQLCKHFGHKFASSFDETQGSVALPMGEVLLTASDAQLNVVVNLAGPDLVERGKDVIDKHLARFAFREDFQAMTWRMED